MATVNMDRLLQACVTQGASDIHLVVHRPPVLRIGNRTNRMWQNHHLSLYDKLY